MESDRYTNSANLLAELHSISGAFAKTDACSFVDAECEADT